MKCFSSSTAPELHNLHSLSLTGCFLYQPLSISNLCELIRNDIKHLWMSVSFITDRYFSFWNTFLKSAYVLNFPWYNSLHWAKLYARFSLKRFMSFVFTRDETFCWYAILVETPNCFNKNFTQEAQLTLSWLAIVQLSLYAHCNNSELVVNNLWKYLHVFTKTLIFKRYLPNSLI